MPDRHFKWGFTLIELLVVIVLITIFAGLTIPMMTAGTETARRRGATGSIVDIMALASSLAATDGRTYRVVVDNERHAVFIAHEADPIEQPGVYTRYAQSAMATYRLDESIRIKGIEIENRSMEALEETKPFLEFRPDSTADQAFLVLETKSGDSWSLHVSGLTSRVRVLEGDILLAREESQ